MSWIVSAGALILGVAAGFFLPYAQMGVGAFVLCLLLFTVTERYRIPGGVSTRAELSVTLAPFTAAMYWYHSFELLIVTFVAAVVGSLSRGRFGAAARWEIGASQAAASTALLVAHLLDPFMPHLAATVAAAVSYSAVRGSITLASLWGSKYAIPSWPAYLLVAFAQIGIGVGMVVSYDIHPGFALLRLVLVWLVIYLWVLLWRYARQMAMVNATLLAAPSTVLPSLDAMTEAIAVAAEREMVLPYVHPNKLEHLVSSGQLDVLAAVVDKDHATSRVFRLSGDVGGHLNHRDGSWTTEYPDWAPKAMESPRQDFFGHDEASGRMFYAFVAGPASGPALVLRVPLLEATWPGQRRMRILAHALTGWTELMLRRYTHSSRSKAQQLQDACARLVSLVESAGPADRVAEQLNHVHTLTTLSMMNARPTAAATPMAPRDRDRSGGVTMGSPPGHGGSA